MENAAKEKEFLLGKATPRGIYTRNHSKILWMSYTRDGKEHRESARTENVEYAVETLNERKRAITPGENFDGPIGGPYRCEDGWFIDIHDDEDPNNVIKKRIFAPTLDEVKKEAKRFYETEKNKKQQNNNTKGVVVFQRLVETLAETAELNKQLVSQNAEILEEIKKTMFLKKNQERAQVSGPVAKCGLYRRSSDNRWVSSVRVAGREKCFYGLTEQEALDKCSEYLGMPVEPRQRKENEKTL
jgi:hypothetical protein